MSPAEPAAGDPGPSREIAPIPALGNPASTLPASAYELCPHCGSRALIEASPSLRFVCGVCGKARVPIDIDGPRSGAEAPALAAASAARNAATAWRVAAGVGGGFGLVSLAVLALVLFAASPPLAAAVVAVMAALVPLAFAAYAAARARKKQGEIEPELDRGWALAAREALLALGAASAPELAAKMRISPELAEGLLMRMSTEGALATRITDDGALEFRPEGSAGVRAAAPAARTRLATEEGPAAAAAAAALDEDAEAAAAQAASAAELPRARQ